MRFLIVVVCLFGSAVAGAMVQPAQATVQLDPEKGQCFVVGFQGQSQKAAFDATVKNFDATFAQLLHKGLQTAYGDASEQFTCEFVFGISKALKIEGKEVSSANIDQTLKLITEMLVASSQGDDFSSHGAAVAALSSSASRSEYWYKFFSGIFSFNRKSGGAFIDLLSDAIRIEDGLEQFSIRSGGVEFDVNVILSATRDYYEIWQRPDLGKYSYVHPAFMTFRDDNGQGYVSMIGADGLFRVAKLDRNSSLRAINASYLKAEAAVNGPDMDDAVFRSIILADLQSDPNAGLTLMVSATERSWQHSLMGLRSYLELDANFENLQNFGDFSGNMAEQLGG